MKKLWLVTGNITIGRRNFDHNALVWADTSVEAVNIYHAEVTTAHFPGEAYVCVHNAFVALGSPVDKPR